METEATVSPAPSVPTAPLWEDFLDIFYAPRAVFARREERRWPVVLLVLVGMMTFLFFASQGVLAPVMEAEIARAMAGNPDITPEQMEQAQRMSGLFGMIGFVVSFPIGVLLTGGVVWAVGKIFDSTASLTVALLIATFAQFPRLLQQVASLAQGLVMDPNSLRSVYSVSVGPARFLDPDAVSALLLSLVGRLDLFVLWGTLLVAIGLQVRGRLSPGQSYLAAALVWLLGALPAIAGALAAG